MTHLFFADDILLFCHTNLDELNTILGILFLYGKALGQQINQEKTTLFLVSVFQMGGRRKLKKKKKKIR